MVDDEVTKLKGDWFSAFTLCGDEAWFEETVTIVYSGPDVSLKGGGGGKRTVTGNWEGKGTLSGDRLNGTWGEKEADPLGAFSLHLLNGDTLVGRYFKVEGNKVYSCQWFLRRDGARTEPTK